MRIVELIIDETEKLSGIDAVSIVEFPAIESNFISLNQHLELAKVDDEKRILMGAALIPNKNIYRRNGNDEYYIFFSDDTVRKASELFLMNSNQNNTTLEHDKKLKDLSVVESWIVEDTEMDKSKKYGLNAPVGTWMVSMKVNNDMIWNDFVKTGKVKGFSIEGYFSDKLEMSLEFAKEQELIEQIKSIILNGEKKKTNLESYTDYPEQATENAKIALRYAEENGWGSCGTPVGKARANQLANREPISEDTISRMASFERQRQNSDRPLGEGCGRLMWLAWGGDAGVEWASRKLEQIRKENLATQKISFDYDNTLSTAKGTELAKTLIKQGNSIYIISARDSKDGMLNKAKELGIAESKVYATGSNENKVAKVKELGIQVHYDNNENVIKQLDGIGKLFKNY